MKRSKVIIILLLCALLVVCSGCTGDEIEEDLVNQQQAQYAAGQPIPFFDYSLEREAVTEIYVSRNDEVTTHTVWRSDYGLIEGDTPSIGYPIPYDVQLTNPVKTVYNSVAGEYAVIEQAEPNGLFSSKNTAATWVRSVVEVNGRTVVAPIYVEGKVTCYPYPVIVNYTTNTVTPVPNVMPSVTLTTGSN